MTYVPSVLDDEQVLSVIKVLKEQCPQTWYTSSQWDYIQGELVNGNRFDLIEQVLGRKISGIQRVGLMGAYKYNLT